jgi:hypothetical protein
MRADRRFHPSRAALREDGLQVALEKSTGVLEILFGGCFGGGDAVKGFVEDADDPPLFPYSYWVGDFERLEIRSGYLRLRGTCNTDLP